MTLSHRGRQHLHLRLIISHLQDPTAHKIGRIYLPTVVSLDYLERPWTRKRAWYVTLYVTYDISI